MEEAKIRELIAMVNNAQALSTDAAVLAVLKQIEKRLGGMLPPISGNLKLG